MNNCRYCNSSDLVKHSFIRGKQRYLSKSCGKNQLSQDGRKKYNDKIIKTAFIIFNEGNGYKYYQKFLI